MTTHNDNYIRVPFKNEDTASQIREELSAKEMAEALVRAHNDSANQGEPDDPESIDSYDSEKEITEASEAGVISDRTEAQLKVKARRSGNRVSRL